jgi:hypothetical protein
MAISAAKWWSFRDNNSELCALGIVAIASDTAEVGVADSDGVYHEPTEAITARRL